jgi:hypothetical protein
MASTNSTLGVSAHHWQYSFFPGQIPATLGALLLGSALLFKAYLVVKRVDTGPVAHLQFCACIASAVSAIGKIINMYGFYSVYEEGLLCSIEAVTFCFGELALLLWQFCTALTLLLMIVRPAGALSAVNAQRDRMFLVFHIFVWSAAVITTVVPWVHGALGMSWYPQNPEETYWCYMKIGQRSWEVGQYYIPQLVSCTFSLLVFCVIMVYLLRNEAARTGASGSGTAKHSSAAADDAHDAEQRAVYARLAFQLFALTAVLLPDSVSYFLVDRGAPGSLLSVRVTGFIWECEGPVIALLWFSNKRVVEAIGHLCSCCDCCCCCCCCGAARDVPLMPSGGGSSHHATELRTRGAARARHASRTHADADSAADETTAKRTGVDADADAALVGVTVAIVE